MSGRRSERHRGMNSPHYRNVIGFGEIPTFHDAELFGIAHHRADRELLLQFQRTNGDTGTFEPVRFLVCRGHETITELTSYDRCNSDQEEQESEGAEAAVLCETILLRLDDA
ncbi:hypothetical protein WJ32_12300 [Burkholderia ubonensis]|nr:hypothetical protein WJ32_12300 [Burkholderia ubonensis]